MRLLTVLLFLLTSSCSSFLKYKKEESLFKNPEFEKKVTIVETEEPKSEEIQANADADASVKPTGEVAPAAQVSAPAGQTSNSTLKNKTQQSSAQAKSAQTKATQATVKPGVQVQNKKTNSAQNKPTKALPTRRLPDIESDEGFGVLRRPATDPFRVGETVVHDVTYLGASAGTLTLKVNPFAVVNGRKSYNFFIDLKSNSFFSNIYAVDDQVQTYVDYEELVPHVFKLNIRDSGQVKEAQSYFDNQTLKADYWEHRYTEKSGHEEKKQSWSILPYSQNPFSAIFYMRIFKFSDNKEYAFRVADDEKNVLFKAQVVERAKLKTAAGTFNAIKLKAEIYSRGNLAKAKDFYLWLSDDDRKYILRIEVKLPIGSIVSEAISIKEGRP